jgi:hypothetical protein
LIRASWRFIWPTYWHGFASLIMFGMRSCVCLLV